MSVVKGTDVDNEGTKPVTQFSGHSSAVTATAWHPDGSLFMSGDDKGTVMTLATWHRC